MKLKGFIFAILSGLFFGSAGLFVKSGIGPTFGPVDLLMLQYIIAILLLFAFCFIKYPHKLRLSRSILLRLLFQGAVLNTLMTVFFYEAFKYLDVALVTMLLYTYPSMVAIASFALYHNRISMTKVLSILGTFIGCLLVMNIFFHHDHLNTLGIFFAVLSAIFYASMNLYAEKLVTDLPGMVITLYSTLFSLGVLFLMNSGFLHRLPQVTSSSLLNAALLSFFCEIIPLTLLYDAISLIGPVNTAIITSLELPSSAVLAFLFLHETLSLPQILGILLVVVCVVRLKNED